MNRYLAEGGGTGTRKRWSDLEGGTEDSEGFAFSAPVEVSFKQHSAQMRRRYVLRLIRKLRAEGVLALGQGATDEDVVRVMAKLRKEIMGDMIFQPKKPKAASKMLVQELKEELAAQELPTDGTRPVLYQRVQKARKINRARGRPLWVPETEEEKDEVCYALNIFFLQTDRIFPTLFISEIGINSGDEVKQWQQLEDRALANPKLKPKSENHMYVYIGLKAPKAYIAMAFSGRGGWRGRYIHAKAEP